MVSITQSAQPWFASVRRDSAMPIDVPAVRHLAAVWLTVDGQAKLRREKTAFTSVATSAYARSGGDAANRGAVSRTGVPALAAAFAASESFAVNEQIQHFTKGGLCGPHPWREPVAT